MWALASVNLSQLMLLAIYVGMFTSDIRRRLMVATFGVFYIGIWQTFGLLDIDVRTSPLVIAGAYLINVCMDAGVIGVLSVLLACTRRAVGIVRRLEVIPANLADTRPQFSLLTLLLVLSIASLVMGPVRSSRMADGPDFAVFWLHYVLFAVVFGINIVATVWSTLGFGSVLLRLIVVVAVSAILGISLGVSIRMDTLGWRLVAYSSVLTLCPTAIIATTLLFLRPSGFRLTRLACDAGAVE